MEQKFFRDLFCFQCSLQCDGKSVYNLHQSLVHGIKDIGKSRDSEIKIEKKSEASESTNDTKISTWPIHEEKQESSKKEILNVHVESAQKEKKSFKCNDCDACFTQKQSLNGHMQSIHKQNKIFNCDICDGGFSQKNYLKKHMESVHKGKKPFECNICDTAFSQKRHLNGHIESVHEGKKPFKCNICDTL